MSKPILKPTKLRDLLVEIKSFMESSFLEKKITINCSLPEPSLLVSADAQLLINLVANAIEAVSTAAEPAVDLSYHQVANAVVLAVRDNGVGIKDEERDKVCHSLPSGPVAQA